jgi:hypothetical protein
VKFEYIDANKRVESGLLVLRPGAAAPRVRLDPLLRAARALRRHDGFSFGGSDIDRYDSEIAYTDAAVGRLIAAVRKRQPNTIDRPRRRSRRGVRRARRPLSRIDAVRRAAPRAADHLDPGIPAHVVDGPVELLDIAPTLLNLLDIPVPVRMRGTDLGPWLACRRRRVAAAAGVRRGRGQADGRRGTDKLLCDLHWGRARTTICAPIRASSTTWPRRVPTRAALRAILDDWLDGHVRFEPLLAKGASNPKGGRCRRRSSAGAWAICWPGPSWPRS